MTGTALIPAGGGRVRSYDFHTQEAIDRGRVRKLQPVFEAAAHRMAGALSANLRQPVHITVEGFEQTPWEGYAASVEDPTFLAGAAVIGLDGRVIVHVPVELVLSLVEVQLGGKGQHQPDRLVLTDLEFSLMSSLVDDMLAALPSAFDAFIEIGIGVVQKLRSIIYLKVGRPGEMCLMVQLNLSIGEGGSRAIHLCFPVTVLHPILEAFERLQQSEGFDGSFRLASAEERLLTVGIDLQVAYPAVGLTTTEVLGLRIGDVIPLHVDKDDRHGHLDVVAGGHRVGKGVLVEQGKRLACTVTSWREERS
ncbi:MAG: FliM/FliN family flagellar motor switch protein [Acidimicrobiales bacterium]